mgnify:FL=1
MKAKKVKKNVEVDLAGWEKVMVEKGETSPLWGSTKAKKVKKPADSTKTLRWRKKVEFNLCRLDHENKRQTKKEIFEFVRKEIRLGAEEETERDSAISRIKGENTILKSSLKHLRKVVESLQEQTASDRISYQDQLRDVRERLRTTGGV